MRIELHHLNVEAIIGILPEERTTPQPVLVDLEAEYPYVGGDYLDYAALADLIRRTLIEEKFGLLEEALTELKERIIEQAPEITRLSLRLSKPEILDDCLVSVGDRWRFDYSGGQ